MERPPPRRRPSPEKRWSRPLSPETERPDAGRTLRPGPCLSFQPRRRGCVMPTDEVIVNQHEILANQKSILANQAKLDRVLANQATITANQETILANQSKLDKALANQATI